MAQKIKIKLVINGVDILVSPLKVGYKLTINGKKYDQYKLVEDDFELDDPTLYDAVGGDAQLLDTMHAFLKRAHKIMTEGE